MTPDERQYKSTTTRLAASMLVFLALFFIYSFAIGILSGMTAGKGAMAKVIYEIVYGLGYAAAFVLPVFFFGWISKGKPRERIYFNAALPKETPMYLFAGLAIISAAAYLNSLMSEVFNYSSFTDTITSAADVTTNYELVLMVFTTAVVPAFVEELLFRGLVLTNLLPYGRTTAIFASALLFGAMHQNAGQFFYATVAGLVLGYLYVKTRTVWCGVLLHFVNNFYSVLSSVWAERLPEETGNIALTLLAVGIFALGILSFVYLLTGEKDETAKIRENGAFGVALPAAPDYAAIEIPARRRVRLFFNAPMIVFFAISASEMLLYILLAAVGTFG